MQLNSKSSITSAHIFSLQPTTPHISETPNIITHLLLSSVSPSVPFLVLNSNPTTYIPPIVAYCCSNPLLFLALSVFFSDQ